MSGKKTMKVNRLRSPRIEIYKSINDINPLQMNEIFKLRETSRAVRSNYKLILDYYGPKIWNSLPSYIKFSENLEAYKNIVKNWNGVSCKCKVCQCH